MNTQHDEQLDPGRASGGTFTWPPGWTPGPLWAPPRSVYPLYNRHRKIGVYDTRADRLAALLDALNGLTLGAEDVLIVRWLAGWDNPTVATVASLIHRTRLAGPLTDRST